jgi:hypothetical protein
MRLGPFLSWLDSGHERQVGRNGKYANVAAYQVNARSALVTFIRNHNSGSNWPILGSRLAHRLNLQQKKL